MPQNNRRKMTLMKLTWTTFVFRNESLCEQLKPWLQFVHLMYKALHKQESISQGQNWNTSEPAVNIQQNILQIFWNHFFFPATVDQMPCNLHRKWWHKFHFYKNRLCNIKRMDCYQFICRSHCIASSQLTEIFNSSRNHL